LAEVWRVPPLIRIRILVLTLIFLLAKKNLMTRERRVKMEELS